MGRRSMSANTQRVSEVARQIATDCATDATALDSTPFTPRGMGETFGSTLAMVAALARAVEALASDMDLVNLTAEVARQYRAIEALTELLDSLYNVSEMHELFAARDDLDSLRSEMLSRTATPFDQETM